MKNNKFSALVTAEHKGMYSVFYGGEEISASLSGRTASCAVSRLDLPVVGDTAEVSVPESAGAALITGLTPRRTLLLRKTAGKESSAQPLAANIEKVFIVMGLDGNFNIQRLERMLAAAWDSGAEPCVALTKSDLCGPEELADKAGQAGRSSPGVKVFCLSSVSGEGTEDFIASELKPGVKCCLLGSSGAGKSTMLNFILGYTAAATGEVRAGDSRGRHTTTSRHLYFMPSGGWIIDTPGVREFGMELSSGGLDASFGDISAAAAGCRFRDCTHSGEPGCAVAAAVESGLIPRERLESWLKLGREAKRLKSCADIRQRLDIKRKQKIFGKTVRDISKNKRRLRGG